jgi:hypothetical protein
MFKKLYTKLALFDSGNVSVWDLEAQAVSETTRGHAGLINAISGTDREKTNTGT